MQRAITGYHQDDEGDWVAELSCGHGQHVRHRPPFQLRPWVIDDAGRMARLGSPLACPLCDRAEPPVGLRLVRSSAEWDEVSMPAGLRRAHRVAAGTWGRIVVHQGRLRFVMWSEPPLEVELGPGATQAIPPDIGHEVRAIGPVRFRVEFLSLDTSRRAGAPQEASDGHPLRGEHVGTPIPQLAVDEGGETACWLHLVCDECGVMLDGGPHRSGCQAGDLG